MTDKTGFIIAGEFIPKSYDRNGDGKLSAFERNSWLKDNNCIFKNNKIIHLNSTPLNVIKSHPLSFHKKEFDGVVGDSYQSKITGDCWLLTGVNSLMTTSWGKKAVKNAITPDGYGGVTVKFKGSFLEQKEFHISAKEIQNAALSGFYSTGDPDMLAIELAAEKFYDKAIAKGKLYHEDYFDKKCGHSTSINGTPMKLPSYEEYMIEELLTGAKPITAVGNNEENYWDVKLLKEISKNKDDYAVQVCFEKWKDLFGQRKEDEPIHGNHAYMIKSINYGVDVTIINPYKTDEEIVLPFDYFLEETAMLTIVPNPYKKTNIGKYRIDSYEKIHGETKRETELDLIEEDKIDKKEQAERQARSDSLSNADKQRRYNDSIMYTHEMFVNSALDEWSFSDYEKENSEKINKDNIMEIFDKDVETFGKGRLIFHLENLIKYKPSPLSFRYQREKLNTKIKDMVDALAEIANEKQIDKNTIENYKAECDRLISKKICFKRHKKLSAQIAEMYNLIKAKESKN